METEYDIDIKKISKRIKDLRKERGLTVEKTAELASLSTQFYSKIENGKRNITPKTIIAIANAFQVDLTFLLSDFVRAKNPEYQPIEKYKDYTFDEIVKLYEASQFLSDFTDENINNETEAE